MKKILFVMYGGGHFQTLIPLVNRLNTRYQVDVIGLGMASPLLYEKGIRHKKVSDFVEFNDIITGIKFVDEFHHSGQGINLIDTISYYGVGYNSLIQMFGQEKAELLFKNYERRVFLPIDFFEKILSETKYELLITTNTSSRYERAALYASKRLNIPSLAIEDLFGSATSYDLCGTIFAKNKDDYELLKNRGLPSVYFDSNYNDEKLFNCPLYDRGLDKTLWFKFKRDVFANYICVISEYVKKSLILKGVLANSIFVTGNPKYDCVNIKNHPAAVIKENSAKYVILYTTQPTDNRDKIIKYLANEFVFGNKIMLIIKPHPVDRIDYSDMISNSPNEQNITIVSRDADIYSLIDSSDVVLTEYSTTGLDAVFRDRDVITIALDEIVPYSKASVAFNIQYIEELEKAIILLQEGELSIKYKEARQEFLALTNSIENIDNVINKIIN